MSPHFVRLIIYRVTWSLDKETLISLWTTITRKLVPLKILQLLPMIQFSYYTTTWWTVSGSSGFVATLMQSILVESWPRDMPEMGSSSHFSHSSDTTKSLCFQKNLVTRVTFQILVVLAKWPLLFQWSQSWQPLCLELLWICFSLVGTAKVNIGNLVLLDWL